jgi:hypothetical protein
MTRQTNPVPRPAAQPDRSKLDARQLRRLIVWTEILDKPLARRKRKIP